MRAFAVLVTGVRRLARPLVTAFFVFNVLVLILTPLFYHKHHSPSKPSLVGQADMYWICVA